MADSKAIRFAIQQQAIASAEATWNLASFSRDGRSSLKRFSSCSSFVKLFQSRINKGTSLLFSIPRIYTTISLRGTFFLILYIAYNVWMGSAPRLPTLVGQSCSARIQWIMEQHVSDGLATELPGYGDKLTWIEESLHNANTRNNTMQKAT